MASSIPRVCPGPPREFVWFRSVRHGYHRHGSGFSLGKEVSVRGFITVPPGLFASFTGEQGFAIEDSTGGIYVQLESAISLQLGKEVRVSGQLAEIAKLTVISSRIALIDQLSQQVVVQPADVTTGAVSAATEGRLVRIQGTITRLIGDDRPYGYKIFLDDGSGETQVFVPVSTGIDPLAFPGLQVGRRLAVIGFSGRFNDTLRIDSAFPSRLGRSVTIEISTAPVLLSVWQFLERSSRAGLDHRQTP